jgi:photosystem II stability/assembly factor-like uncharacterized protein
MVRLWWLVWVLGAGCGWDPVGAPPLVAKPVEPVISSSSPTSFHRVPLVLPKGVTDECVAGVWASGPTDLYAMGSQALWHSQDGGRTFRGAIPTCPAGAKDCYLRGIGGSGPDDVYLSQGLLVQRSTDGGTTFAPTSTDANGIVGAIWAAGPDDVEVTQVPFGACDGYDVLASTDHGKTWNEGEGAGENTSALDPVSPPSLWGSGKTRVMATTITSYGAPGPGSVAISSLVLLSTDGGASWQRSYVPARGGLDAVAGVGDTILESGPKGTFRTTDDAQTWAQVAKLHALAMASDGSTVYAVGARGVAAMSKDAGTTWTRLATGVTGDLDTAWAGDGVVLVGGGCSNTASTPILLESP